jgi:hypothetical protein
MLNGLSRLSDGLGENILFIEALPLTAFIELDKMSQRAAGAEQLPLGVLMLDIGCQSFGHGTKCYNSVVQIVPASRKECLNTWNSCYLNASLRRGAINDPGVAG